MTEYKNTVNKQRLLLEAEEWSKGVKTIHTHRISSMWYDTRPEDTNDSHVTDIEYNSGLVKRSKDGLHIHTFGKALTGDELIDSYRRSSV